MQAFRVYADETEDLQRPFDVAAVVSTIVRPQLTDALRSIFEQDFNGRIQVLIGVDRPSGALDLIDEACRERPSNVTVLLFYPGYSTSVRHGGLHPARDGGALRCILTYLANSRLVAYLDDDNWWGSDHLSTMIEAIHGHDWAYALRWYVHPDSRVPVCVDEWESVGPDKGVQREAFGGAVDTNCLMVDKLRCEPVIRLWTQPVAGDKKGMSADRSVFGDLRAHYTCATNGKPTVYYEVDPNDPSHPYRLQWMGEAYERAGTASRVFPARTRVRDLLFDDDPYRDIEADAAAPSPEAECYLNPYLEFAARRNRTPLIVEVGAETGATAILTAQLLEALELIGPEVVCVGNWLGSADEWLDRRDGGGRPSLHLKDGYPTRYRRFLETVAASGCASLVTPLPLPPREAYEVLSAHKVIVDVVVFHGLRDYAGTIESLGAYWTLLRPGGTMIGEDFEQSKHGVIRAISEFADRVDRKILLSDQQVRWAIGK